MTCPTPAEMASIADAIEAAISSCLAECGLDPISHWARGACPIPACCTNGGGVALWDDGFTQTLENGCVTLSEVRFVVDVVRCATHRLSKDGQVVATNYEAEATLAHSVWADRNALWFCLADRIGAIRCAMGWSSCEAPRIVSMSPRCGIECVGTRFVLAFPLGAAFVAPPLPPPAMPDYNPGDTTE